MPPSPPRQDGFKAHAEANQPTYSPPGRSRRPALGPPVPGYWPWSRCGELGPSLPSRGVWLCKSVSVWLRTGRTSIRCRRRPPLQMDDDDDHYAPAPVPPQAQLRRRCPPQSMDESGQGPRTAIAVAVASPLGVQPSMNSAGISSSTGQPLGTIAACKSYALRPVLRLCLTVGRRRCRSPKAGVGELHTAAPEASFIGPSGHRCPPSH